MINICNGQSITFVDSSIGTSEVVEFWEWIFRQRDSYWTSEPLILRTYYDTLTVWRVRDTARYRFMVVVDSASGPDIYCISVFVRGDTVTYHTNFNCTNYNWTVTGSFFILFLLRAVIPPQLFGEAARELLHWVFPDAPPTTCTIATIKTIEIVPATLAIEGDTVICAGSTTTYCVHCIPGNNHSWELMPANAGTVTGQNTCCITVNWNPTFTGIATIVVNYQNVLTGSGCNLPESCSHDNGCGGSGIINVNVLPIFGISGPAKVCPVWSVLHSTEWILQPIQSHQVFMEIDYSGFPRILLASTALFQCLCMDRWTQYLPTHCLCSSGSLLQWFRYDNSRSCRH